MQVQTEEIPQKKPSNISEAELAQFALDRENFRIHKKTMEKTEEALKAREKDLIARIEKGAKVLTKSFMVAVDRSDTRRNVKWKEVAVNVWNLFGRNGAAEAEKVMEATKPDVYPKLVISVKPG